MLLFAMIDQCVAPDMWHPASSNNFSCVHQRPLDIYTRTLQQRTFQGLFDPEAMSRGSGYHEPWELQVGEEWWEDLSEMDNLTEESLLQELRRQYEGEANVFSFCRPPFHRIGAMRKLLRQLSQQIDTSPVSHNLNRSMSDADIELAMTLPSCSSKATDT